MLSYTIDHSLEDRDDATIAEVTNRLRKNEFQGRELIGGIVRSYPFQ